MPILEPNIVFDTGSFKALFLDTSTNHIFELKVVDGVLTLVDTGEIQS